MPIPAYCPVRVEPVQGPGGPAATVPFGGAGPFAAFLSQAYQRSVPLDAMKKLAPQAEFRFRDGRYISEAVAQAKRADVVILFATQWSTEGLDQPDLSLPNGEDALIEAVARANPNTIVVLETGGPILMPWLDRTAAVVEASVSRRARWRGDRVRSVRRHQSVGTLADHLSGRARQAAAHRGRRLRHA